ncbi:Rib/alpha-like domain-containing protein, partial [Lactobacillus mulieris]|uniref:Rib/alpha-like domain-containing protein n=1 Tax=Lactobacillus mulieris TaxID=2508708 RepID=UPI0028E7CF68
MLSKNNKKMRAMKMATDRQQHFSLRKLSVGLVSVLMGTTVFLTSQSTIAKADTLPVTTSSTDKKVEDTKESQEASSESNATDESKVASSFSQSTESEASTSQSSNNSQNTSKDKATTSQATSSVESSNTDSQVANNNTTELKVSGTDRTANVNELAESKAQSNDVSVQEVSDWKSFDSALRNASINTININADFTSNNYNNNVSRYWITSRKLTINGNGHKVDFGSIGYYMNPAQQVTADVILENGTFTSKSATGPFAFLSGYDRNSKISQPGNATHKITLKDVTIDAGQGAYANNAEIDLEGNVNINAGSYYISPITNQKVYTETGGNRAGIEAAWIIIKPSANVTINTDHGAALANDNSDSNHKIEVGANATLNATYNHSTWGTPDAGMKTAVLSNGANGGTVIFHTGSKATFNMANNNVTNLNGNGNSSWGDGSVLYLGAATTTIEKGATVTINNPKESHTDNSIFLRNDGTSLNVYGNLIINDGARNYTFRMDNRVTLNVGQKLGDNDFSNDNGKLIVNRDGDFYLNNDGGALSLWGPITVNVNSGARLEINSTGITGNRGTGQRQSLLRVGSSSKLNVYKRGTFILKDNSTGTVSLVNQYSANGNFYFDNTADVIFDISQNGSQNSRIFSLPGQLVATNDSVRAMLSPTSSIANMGTFKKVQLPLNGSGTVTGTTLHSDYQQIGYDNITSINNAIRNGQLRYLEFSTREVNKPSITGEGQGFTDNGAQLKGNVVDESTETGAVAVVYDSKNNELGRGNVDDNGNFTINLAKPLLNKEGVRVRIETPRGAGAFATTAAPLGPTVKSPITVGRDQSLVGQDASQYITNKDAISNLKPGSTSFDDSDYEPTFSKAAWKSVDFDKKQGVITVTYKDNTTTDLTVDLNVKDVITDADKYTPEAGTIKVDNGHKLDGDDAYDAITNHDSLPADKTTGYNWVVDDTHPAVDTTKPGDHKGYVQVTYEDGSKSDPVEVTVHVIGDNEKYNAVPKTLNVKKNDTVNPEDLIANREGDATQDGKTYTKLPDGTKYDWVGTPISTKDGGVKHGQVKVTYPDGTTQVVDVTVNVYEDANLSTVVGKDINAKLNEDLTNRAIDAIDTTKSTNLPTDSSAYTWASKVDTSTSGDKPATVVVTYPDGSQNSVNVTVHVISDADKYPIATQIITVTKGYDLNGKANLGIANDGKDATVDGKSYTKLPDRTTYEWSGLGTATAPDTSTPYQKNVDIKVTFPDGSSKVVSTILRVTDNGQTDAENHKLQPAIQYAYVGQDMSDSSYARKGILNADEQTGATFRWRNGFVPDTSKAGWTSGIVVVTYQDYSINEQEVWVYVQSGADRYPIETTTITVAKGTNISDKSWARKGIYNADQAGKDNPQLPAGTDVIWYNGAPDTSTPKQKVGYVEVTFPDKSHKVVPVTVIVTDNGQSDAEKNPIEGQDITVYIGNKPNIKDGIKDSDKIKNLRSEDPFTWKGSEPDTSTAGDKDAVIIAHYQDGSSNEVQITVHVKAMADDYTPQGQTVKASLNEDLSGTNRAEDAISNAKDMPDDTTYTWKEKVDTSKAGSKPAVVIVTFKDKSTKEVPVTVQVSSLANDYKDKIDVKTDTRMIHAKWKDDIKNYPAVDGIANAKTETTTDGKNYPNLTPVLNNQDPDTAIVWKTAPDLSTPGQTSGVATITFKDGSTRDVIIPVLVQTDADTNTPDVTTIKVKPGSTEKLNAEDGVANYGKDATHTKLPEGTKVTFDDQSGVDDFAQHGIPGQTKEFDATITYPDSSTAKIKIPVHVIGDNEVYTPVPQSIKTTKGNLPEAKAGIANYDKDVTQDGKSISKLPDGTIVVWANPGQAQKDISEMNPGDTKSFDAVVIYPDKTTANVSIPVTIAKDADIYPIAKQPIVLHDRTLPDNADDGLANLHKAIDFKTPQLPDDTHAEWKDKTAAQEIVKNMTPGDTVSIPAIVKFPDGSTKSEGMDVIVHLHGQADDVDVKTQQVDLNKDGSLPDAKKGIQDVDNIPHLKDVEWGNKDGKPASELVKGMKPGDTRDIPAVVHFEDGSHKDVTIPVHMHGQADDYDVQTKKVDTDHNGQLPEAKTGIENYDELPKGTTVDWGKDAQKTVDQTQPGTDVDVPATVTFPDGSKKEVTIPVHKYGISDDATITPKDVTTEDGTLPDDASEGIDHVSFTDGPDKTPAEIIADGGKIEWGDGAKEAAGALKPGEHTKVTVKVTFRDGSEKDVQVTVTRKDNNSGLNDPTVKVPVKDKSHITGDDKNQVIKNVKDANPGKEITDISVDDNGTFHGKVNGKDVTIPGDRTVYEKDDDNTGLNNPNVKVPVKDKDHITDDDKSQVIKNVKDANPGKDITDISVDDNGTFHGKVNGKDV